MLCAQSLIYMVYDSQVLEFDMGDSLPFIDNVATLGDCGPGSTRMHVSANLFLLVSSR